MMSLRKDINGAAVLVYMSELSCPSSLHFTYLIVVAICLGAAVLLIYNSLSHNIYVQLYTYVTAIYTFMCTSKIK